MSATTIAEQQLSEQMDDHVENYLDDQGITCSLEELCEAYHDLKESNLKLRKSFEAVEQSTESSAYQEAEIERLTEQLKLSEDKVRELTHENDDYDELVPDGVKLSTFDWVEDRLAKADVMEEVIQELKQENRGLTILKQEAESRSFCYEADIKELKEMVKKQGDQLIIFHAKEEKPHTPSSACAHAVLEVKNCEIEGLTEQLNLSEEKGQAKSDIIINMLDRLIKDANIDDGFYIGRQWGNPYSDEHNKIITEEFQELLKDINQDLDGEFEIRTNGYQFDFHSPESESEDEAEEVPKEEEEVPESKVDMEAFNKLKEDGMMPWSK